MYSFRRRDAYFDDALDTPMSFERRSQPVRECWIEDVDRVGELTVVLHFAEKNRAFHAGRCGTVDLIERQEITVVGPEAIAGGVANRDESGNRQPGDQQSNKHLDQPARPATASFLLFHHTFNSC